MTVVAAWVRTTKRGAEELVMVADSRLNGGGYLDCAPKIFQLPRTDIVLGFSGLTLLAYPLLLQTIQAVAAHNPFVARAIDYPKFRTYLIGILNVMFRTFDTYVDEYKKPDTAFLLGGYSWFHKRFCIDTISYNKSTRVFEHQSCKAGMGNLGKVMFIGDWARRARTKLCLDLTAKYGNEIFDRSSCRPERYNMEPFEVVRDLLRAADRHETIGGAPQLVTVSQFMNSRHTAIYWPNRAEGQIFLGGRPVSGFEKIENWILDPDTLDKEHLLYGDTV